MGLFRRFIVRWNFWREQSRLRRELGRQRQRLLMDLTHAVRHPASGGRADKVGRGLERLRQVDTVYKELVLLRWKRITVMLLMLVATTWAVLLNLKQSPAPFQLNGNFSSVLFRATTAIELEPGYSAPWQRVARMVHVDTTWSYTAGTPFPERVPQTLVSNDPEPLWLSHIRIPSGTMVRLQRDGNSWALAMCPPRETRSALSITIYKEHGAWGREGDSTTTYPDGITLSAASEWCILRMTDLRLELPCVPVDTVRFATSNYLHTEPPRSAVLEASLSTGNGRTAPVGLLQHDTLAIRLQGASTFCLRTDSAGVRVTQTGEALQLLAGNGLDARGLDRRSSLFAAWISGVPADVRTFFFSVMLALLGYFIFQHRRL